jgi:multimeric flavodoxin WrbA
LVGDQTNATLDDLEWADGVAFGTPTRFGNVAGKLKQFIDQAGRLWQDGRLADKAATAFTSSQTTHGGQESTILALCNTFYHWGMVIVTLGYTVREVFAASWATHRRCDWHGSRTGGAPRRYAAVIAAARAAGQLPPPGGTLPLPARV